jgi:hypothetical protein
MRVQFRNGIQHDYRDTYQDHQDQDDVEPFPRRRLGAEDYLVEPLLQWRLLSFRHVRFDMSLLSFAARALVVSLY